MKADSQRLALQKAKALANKLNEVTYILKDSHGYYAVDELTVCVDLRKRKIIKEVKPVE